MIKKNSVIEAEIVDQNNLGYGIARLPSPPGVIFVTGGVRGDKLRIKIIKVTKSWAAAIIENIITPSPDRTEPDCIVSTSCGGCSFSHIKYERELEIKRDTVRGMLTREGVEAKVAPVVSDGRIRGWRNKLILPFEDGRLGFYAPRSHRIVENDGCPSMSPAFDGIAQYLKPRMTNSMRALYMRASSTGDVMVCFVTKTDTAVDIGLARSISEYFPQVKSVIQNINEEDTNVVLGKKCVTLYGDDTLTDKLCGLKFCISPLSFYQVNHDMAELLYEKAFELCSPKPGDRITDLFCGIGTIGLYFASCQTDITLTGVETIEAAVRDARVNAGMNNIRNANFTACDASSVSLDGSDAVIVDPPRRGLDSTVIDKIVSSGVKKVVYISCSPDTLARDLKQFCLSGYSVGDVTPYNLFPRTGHVESVALITKL